MKRMFIALISLFLLSGSVFAQNMVIGSLDTGKIAPYLRKMQMAEVKKLKEKFNTPEIKAIKQKLTARREKLNDSKQKLNKEQKQKLQKSIQKLSGELREKMMAMSDTMGQQGQNMQNRLVERFKEVVKKVADARKVDVVFPDNALLYANHTIDITDDVIKELEKVTQ